MIAEYLARKLDEAERWAALMEKIATEGDCPKSGLGYKNEEAVKLQKEADREIVILKELIDMVEEQSKCAP